jgi:ABC-type transport system involved in multi-copper enzyme maturation permease subunit
MTKSSSPARLATIALNTFREAVRDRVLYNLVIFVLLITAGAIVLGELTAGQEARTIVNLGLSAMLLFGAFISIFVGVSLVSKEIEKRTVYAIFAKPVGRGEFVIGKYLGLVLTLFVNVAVMGVGVSLAVLAVGGGTLALKIWGAVGLIFLQLAVLTSVAVVFSSFSSPALSALLTFMIFIAGHFSSVLKGLADSLGSGAAKAIFGTLYIVLPNFSNFSFITEASRGMKPTLSMAVGGVLYAVVYSAVMLVIAVLVFRRRNFK